MSSELAGARWWRFDFHTHTPASDDYGRGLAQASLRQRTPRDWLLDFMRAEIDCVAITDHNTGAWIDRLKAAYAELATEAPADFRPLHLFPGVEINVNGGVHLLAILGPEKSGSDIDSLLGAVGLPGSASASIEGCSAQSIVQVAEAIRRAGGLAIPAHVDGPSGLFSVCKGETLRGVLDCNAVVAMELLDPAFEKAHVDRKHVIPRSEVLGSDSHHPSGQDGQRHPGSHFTSVKMGTPSLDGLRLALLDGAPLSIRRSDVEGDDPNQHASLVIESVEIADALYAGRGRCPLVARFSPWMTALIGGRGTGKSTVLEMVRLATRREGELPSDLKGEFDRFRSVPVSRGEGGGALTQETRVALTLRKDGVRFRVSWSQSGAVSSIEEEDARGAWTRSPGDVRGRFPVRIFSQKQVFALSGDPGALLRLIDEAPAVNRADWDARRQELETRFLRLRSQARELGAQLGERSRVEGELADVRRQLAVFEEGGHRELLVSYQRLGRQRRVLDDRATELERAVESIRRYTGDVEPSDVRVDDFAAGAPPEAEALGLLEEAARKQTEVSSRMLALASELDAFRQDWGERVRRSSWSRGEEAVGGRYRALVERLAQEGVEDPTAYGALVQRRQTLERKLADFGALTGRMQQIEEQARETLVELEAWRVTLSQNRIEFLERVLRGNEFVKIELVLFGSDARSAEPEFRHRLAREKEGLEKDILSEDGDSGLLAELYRELPAERVERIEAMQHRARERKREITMAASGFPSPSRTKWFQNHVEKLRPEQIDRLELWWPEDGLDVAYRRGGTGRFVPIAYGSPGQKSAAILAFLLSHGDEPILLDQPEDDLDNHLIYELIVQQIRENKRRRQVIVATHNPNIVVNGDAEMVIAMDHVKGQCVVVEKGTGCLQESGVRDEICRVMEGGRRAFEARYKRLLEEMDRVR
jgi:energy-coupling factor transporter ATP-binding protein EcfA2